jgi:hypothetical protein
MTALKEFYKSCPTKAQLINYLNDLVRQYPEAMSKLVFAGIFQTRPDWAARLAQWLALLDQKVAGHPDDEYLWRLVREGMLTFRDLKDGTADLGDVVAANEALDRCLAQQARVGTVKDRSTKKIVLAVEEALQMLRDAPAGTTVRDVAIALAPKYGISPHYIETKVGEARKPKRAGPEKL